MALMEVESSYSYPAEGPRNVYDLGAPRGAELLDRSLPVKSSPKTKFATNPGWTWAIEPRDMLRLSGLATAGLVLGLDRTEKGLSLYLAFPPSKTRYRPIAFDADRRRYEFDAQSGASNDDVRLSSYLLRAEVLPYIRYVGITSARRR